MFFAMLFIGRMFGLLRSITARSAFLPTAMPSQSFKPIARAPPTQAASSTFAASTAEASFSRYLASALTRYISRNMSRALFEPAPSVPMARAMPSSIKRFTGAIPLASLRFEAGFKTAVRPRFLNIAISSSLMWTQWNAPPP